MFAMLAAVTIIAAVFANFLLSGNADRNVPPIILPPEISESIDVGIGNVGRVTPAPDMVEVTPENLAEVILSIERPSEYCADYVVSLYWDDYSSAVVGTVWSSGDLRRINVGERVGRDSYNFIIAGDLTYIWREGDKTYYVGATGEFADDDAVGIHTYEDLAAVPPDDVILCGYSVIDERPCIYAETQDELGQAVKWWVTLDDGLLLSSEVWSDEQMIYRCFLRSLNDAPQFADVFRLPDGNLVS